MKILFSLLLCLGLCVPLPAVSAKAASERVFTATIFPVWLLLREVTHDVPGVEATLLLPAASGCPHDYAMTPADRRALFRADVLVLNGLGLEGFLGDDGRTRSLLKPEAAIVDASRGVQDLLPDEGHGHDHGDHEHHGCSGNPHIFAAPSTMADMVRSIADQLAELDSERASLYRANASRAAQRLEALAAECRRVGESLGARSIVTQHSALDYLARDLGLTVKAHIQPHEGQEPSARDMLELVRLIRAEGVAALILESGSPDRIGRTLAAETDIPRVMLDTASNGPDDLPHPLDWYETIIRDNLRALEQALGTR
ncbi:metal ABC transporter substrate-binding protein [Mailhella sp.]|uniref:metal ABC transporter substrate-binding protein n=1 Tax=Mailhella sp. TaxID=1981029 RepID=UPI004063D6E7